jgi:hypothetical protein
VFRWAFISITLLALIPATGCNLFALSSVEPGSEATQLQQEFRAFILPVSRMTMKVSRIFDVAKQTRQFAGIEPLVTSQWFLKRSDTSGLADYPFEDKSPSERLALLPHIEIINQTTTVIVLANQAGISGKLTTPSRTSGSSVSDEQLRLAARRSVVGPDLAPCSVYPDFLIARLLHVLLEFRIDLQNVAGVAIGTTTTGYEIVWLTPTLATSEDAATVNVALLGLINQIETTFRQYLSPFSALGCVAENQDIINSDAVGMYVDDVLIRSLSKYFVNVGDPGNPGIGDNDGDGLVDEETIDGRDNDGDGLIDEDAKL